MNTIQRKAYTVIDLLVITMLTFGSLLVPLLNRGAKAEETPTFVVDETEDTCTETMLTIVSDGTASSSIGTTILPVPHPAWISIEGASWIWNDTSLTTENQSLTFTQNFNLSSTVTLATLDIAADNGYEAYINGNLIDSKDFSGDDPTNYNTVHTFSVDPTIFINGLNAIVVSATNLGVADSTLETNPGGVIYKLTLATENCVPENQIKVHIAKYLDGTQAMTETVDGGYQFPMSATWTSTNLGSGTGNYVLGNNHGGAPLAYQADTSAMDIPADYTTHEITNDIDETSLVLPIGEQCSPGKFRLLGYKEGTSFEEAAASEISTIAPNFSGLSTDKYIIVYNESCPMPTDDTMPICGNSVIDQDWEQCDGSSSCTEQCQLNDQNQCTDLILARVTINNSFNKKNGDVEKKVFLGGQNSEIPNGTWFPLHFNGTDIADPEVITSFADVPGIAVQRVNKKVKFALFGSHTQEEPGKEHLDGVVDFWNSDVLTVDSAKGKFHLEKGFDGTGTTAYKAGNDEVTMFNDHVNFWLTVTGKNDAFVVKRSAAKNICSETTSGSGETGSSEGSTDTTGTGSETASSEGTSGSTDGSGTGGETTTGTTGGEGTTSTTGDTGGTSGETTTTTGSSGSTTGAGTGSTTGGGTGLDLPPTTGGGTGTIGGNGTGGGTGLVLGVFNPGLGGSGGGAGSGGKVLGESIACEAYLNDYLRKGYKNNSDEVKKLQQFLNENLGRAIPINGIFGPMTYQAVKDFQQKEFSEIITPWNINHTTGIVYKTTKRRINNLKCPDLQLPIPYPLLPW